MISITVASDNLLQSDAKAKVLFVEQGYDPRTLAPFSSLFASISQLLKERNFTGATATSVVIPVLHAEDHMYLIVVGLGKKNENHFLDIENYRRAIGRLMRVMEELKINSAAFELPQASLYDAPLSYLAGQTAQMISIASYHFDEYITNPERKIAESRAITIVYNGAGKKEIQAGIKTGEIIADAVNEARHWIDLPPIMMHPEILAQQAHDIARAYDLDFTLFTEEEIIKMGMGGLAGVSAGSDKSCQLVIMEYHTSKKNAPTLAFVGKGITFDSGGLSIKPANHMETMKEDMSGAAAVIATMKVLAQLKPAVNVIGVAPISENLPSGTATKPGDIVRFYNGKTAEVKNTDAEGRLILADALSYTVKHYKPDAIIDIATLTGSCAHALGPFYSGLMSENDKLVTLLKESATRTGDRVWQLPLHTDYLPAIKSAVADISNIGSPKYLAGAVTAALFLQHFVDATPWAHLDIAGVAFDVPDLPYYRPHSATGFGVRLLVDVAMNWR